MERQIRGPIRKDTRWYAFTSYRLMKMLFDYDKGCFLALDTKHRLHDTVEMFILQDRDTGSETGG